MSGIAGFSVYTESLTEEKYLWMALARRMARRISHRGPDDRGATFPSTARWPTYGLPCRIRKTGCSP